MREALLIVAIVLFVLAALVPAEGPYTAHGSRLIPAGLAFLAGAFLEPLL